MAGLKYPSQGVDINHDKNVTKFIRLFQKEQPADEL